MTHMIRQLATDVAAVLNAATFSETVTVRRGYLVYSKQDAFEGAIATVVPDTRNSQIQNRAFAQRHEVAIAVLVHKQLTTADVTEGDAMMDLVEEIEDKLKAMTPTVTTATLIDMELEPVDDHEWLDMNGLWKSQITLTFLVVA